MQQEECSVCYRGFSTTLVPFLLVCGHSFCDACSSMVRCCPLCRHQVPLNHVKRTNYSLLSLLEKLERRPNIDRSEQQTQTDLDSMSSSSTRHLRTKPSFFDGRTMTLNLRPSGLQVAIK